MKFSIIIPVFNGAAALPRCLDSVAGCPDAEILLIDDGSTDETWEICQEYSRNHPNLRIFQQPHRGVSAARNVGLRHARGEFILFLDGDDALISLPDPENCRSVGVAEALPLFRQEQLCQLWNKVFRADVIRDRNLRFREELFVYEDLEFVMQYVQAAGELLLAPDWCRHAPSGLAIRRAGRLESLASVLEFLPAELKPELATILTRQRIAAAPHRAVKLCREYRKYCPKSPVFPILKGALALRWRS